MSTHRHEASYAYPQTSGTSARFGGRLVATGTCRCGIEIVQLLTAGVVHCQQRAPWRPVAELLGPAAVSLVKATAPATVAASCRRDAGRYTVEVDGQVIEFRARTEFATVILGRVEDPAVMDGAWWVMAKSSKRCPAAARQRAAMRLARNWPSSRGEVLAVEVTR